MINIEDLNSLGDSVILWNTLAGNTDNLSSEELDFDRALNQAERILEEAQEYVDALKEGNIMEALKEFTDVLIVAFGGLLPWLKLNEGRRVGFAGALNEVQINNFLKITTSPEIAIQWHDEHTSKGTECYIYEKVFAENKYYCVRRTSDNKILKPSSHPKVNLEQFIINDREAANDTEQQEQHS